MAAAAAFTDLRIAGKYREIVFAVACFLVFDLAVLGLNVVISTQISADAQAINLAGRQRMLSQRIAKVLFSMQARSPALEGAELTDAHTELGRSATLFSATLDAFAHGGVVSGGDGQPAQLAALASTHGQEILTQAGTAWQPWSAALAPLLAGDPDPEALGRASAAAHAANPVLLDLMNQLTSEVEALARRQTTRLRLVQAVGVLLALANFCFILLRFTRRLSASEHAAQAAQREIGQILGSVREGLFLIDRERRIGTQATASLAAILGHPAQPGAPFADLLQALAEPRACAAAADYIDLLFEAKIKPALMDELNPLVQLRVQAPAGEPGAERHLSFRFTPVSEAGGGARAVSHLLVAVADISAQMRMQRELASARHQAKGEIEMLLGMLGSNPGALEAFARDSEAALREANHRLRHPGIDPAGVRVTIDAVFRLVHGIKGDAASMGLGLFETQAHAFESRLAALREQAQLSAADLLGLPLQLEEFYERLSLIRAFADQIARAAAQVAPLDAEASLDAAPAGAQLDLSLTQLAQRIAQDMHKTVEVETSLDQLAALAPATAKHVKDIALQLARNAIAHGIEGPEERERLSKPAAGRLEVRLSRIAPAEGEADGEYELLLRDDGRGLNPQAIREALTASGRYTPAQLDELDDRQIMMKIFEPGFSTAVQTGEEAGRDAGRGVGLDLVNDKIGRLGGRLRLASQPGRYTEFAVRFAG
ncbi:MAG TPA: ATP-binding protein [Burkholderiales bacterium]|jgi:HPt (histidine-containing phosphotransfer) domain-containing protein|nr:ATP-binding protein [Burkholderiales bacterium]